MEKCSARRHLRGADFSVYDASRQLTARARQNNEPAICNASRETLAQMTTYSVRTITAARYRLVALGWWRPLSATWITDQRRTGAAGEFKTPAFLVIEHGEWAQSNPGHCSDREQFTAHGSTAHGTTADGQTAHGAAANSVAVIAANTATRKVLAKPYSSFKPESKPETLCSLLCADGWQFLGMKKTGSEKFRTIFDAAFLDYQKESDACRENSECSCDRTAFIEDVLDRCEKQRVRYPRELLAMKKRLKKRAS